MKSLTLVCSNCKVTFEVAAWRSNNPKYRVKHCSRKCAALGRRHLRPVAYGRLSLGYDIWAAVDEEDAIWLRQGENWHLSPHGYAISSRAGATRLNRVIMERIVQRKLLPTELVDHKNGDRLDNCRSNLRIADHSKNGINRSVPTSARSGFRGVRRDTQETHSFYASIMYHQQNIYIGSFDTAEEAAWNRDQWALALFDGFAPLNFEYI